MKKNKEILLAIIVFLLTNTFAYCQDTSDYSKNQFEGANVLLELVDSISKQCNNCYKVTDSIYKFEVKHIYRGECKYKYIYVCIDSFSIRKFNPNKRKKAKYYLGVIKTDKFLDDIPIYLHSGNF